MSRNSGAQEMFSHKAEPDHIRKEMEAIRNRLSIVLFLLGFLFGGIVLIVSLFRSFQYGLYANGISYSLIYLLSMGIVCFRRRLQERIVLGLFSGLLAAAAAHVLLTVEGGVEGLPFLFFLSLLLVSVPVIFNYVCNAFTERLDSVDSTISQLRLETDAQTRTADELRENESKYRSIIENLPVAFAIVLDGRFRLVNPRYCHMTGYTCDDLVDKLGPADITPPDHRDKVAKHYRSLLSGEPAPTCENQTIAKKDGALIAVKVLAGRLTFRGKPAICLCLMDITYEKMLESKLIQSQKMEAIGTLAGGIAHDFNNILSALMGFASMLHMAMDDKDPLKRYTSNILSASERAAGLTQSLLTFSRSNPIELKAININTIIDDTKDLLRRVITEDIAFDIDLSPEPIHIRADAIQINQILFNLVGNAMDAMTDGGQLEINTGIEELDKAFIIRNGFGKNGTYGRITVTDNGVGMDQATVGKIFDPFFTTKDIGKGTGLGLSTVYGIVKQHNGYIRVSSTPGQGTSFHIYFPLTSASSKAENRFPQNFRAGQETILVAEDDTITRCFIRDLLTHHGYNVIEAENGKEALVQFQAHPKASLLILDTIMPEKNGKEVYDAIRKKRPDIPALFISGYPRDVVISKGHLEPSMAFMSKPLYPNVFMQKVGKILDGQKNKLNNKTEEMVSRMKLKQPAPG